MLNQIMNSILISKSMVVLKRQSINKGSILNSKILIVFKEVKQEIQRTSICNPYNDNKFNNK